MREEVERRRGGGRDIKEGAGRMSRGRKKGRAKG
jgi:hypothetical protein